ncbi:GNAT family N-acetyltransferase [Streptosporangium sp. NPDC006007]|uniref:GNAT family N-acetyltransferase n=1 Tax=Streptosporangium sp. NPDC006007 TaxID=3154575 RepID=UPI0033B587D3
MTVTLASPENADAIVALLEEMDRFYGATDIEPFDVRVRQVQQALFADPPAAYALLAWEGEKLAGIASYSFLWPAVGLTRSLYLKELYVSQEQRRAGIGTLLMRALFEIAAKHECSRVEWTTDKDNAAAQRFYEKLDPLRLPTELFYRVDSEMIDQRLR